MKKRRKTIYAGTLVKIVEYTPPKPRDTPRQRAAKHKATTAAQKALNFKTAQGRLELKLAANFNTSDYFCTFTYSAGQEPASRKEANRHKVQFLRRLREVRRRRGQLLKWIFAIEGKHGEHRWHLHAVINSADQHLDFDEICSLWPFGRVEVKRLFDADHVGSTWLDIARYMTKERPEDGKDQTPVGAQIYSCSRNLVNPLTDPSCIKTEWIEDGAPLELPADSFIIDREETENEYSTFKYIKYMTEPLHHMTKPLHRRD